MLKQLFFSALLFTTSISIYSETKIILHPKKGGDIEVYLKDKPIATYEGSELVITTTTATLHFQLSELEDMTFEEYPNHIESVTIISKEVGSTQVFDLNGHLIKSFSPDQVLETLQLPHGIYIIKCNNQTYKIYKK